MRTQTTLPDSVQDLLEDVRASRLPPPAERRATRVLANVSLREAGAALGVDPMTVLRWERGATPRRDHAIAYGAFLRALREATS